MADIYRCFICKRGWNDWSQVPHFTRGKPKHAYCRQCAFTNLEIIAKIPDGAPPEPPVPAPGAMLMLQNEPSQAHPGGVGMQLAPIMPTAMLQAQNPLVVSLQKYATDNSIGIHSGMIILTPQIAESILESKKAHGLATWTPPHPCTGDCGSVFLCESDYIHWSRAKPRKPWCIWCYSVNYSSTPCPPKPQFVKPSAPKPQPKCGKGSLVPNERRASVASSADGHPSVSSSNRPASCDPPGSQVSQANGMQVPQSNGTLVPQSNGTQVPPSNGALVPPSNGTQGPPSNAMQGQRSDGAQLPHFNGAQGPLSNGMQEPRSDGAQLPQSNGAQGPLSNGMQGPRSDGAQLPHFNGAQGPLSNGMQGPRSDGALVPPSNGTQVPPSTGAPTPPQSDSSQVRQPVGARPLPPPTPASSADPRHSGGRPQPPIYVQPAPPPNHVRPETTGGQSLQPPPYSQPVGQALQPPATSPLAPNGAQLLQQPLQPPANIPNSARPELNGAHSSSTLQPRLNVVPTPPTSGVPKPPNAQLPTSSEKQLDSDQRPILEPSPVPIAPNPTDDVRLPNTVAWTAVCIESWDNEGDNQYLSLESGDIINIMRQEPPCDHENDYKKCWLYGTKNDLEGWFPGDWVAKQKVV